MKKIKTLRVKFLEYLGECHPEEAKEWLSNYENNNIFTLEYQSLKQYDENMAEMLTTHTEDTLHAFTSTLQGSSKIPDDAKINFNIIHFDNMLKLDEITSDYVGELIRIKGIIRKSSEVYPVLDKAIFECRSCMSWQEVEQTSVNNITEPTICGECGGRSFRLLRDISSYVDQQVLTIGSPDTSFEIDCILRDSWCSHDDYSINKTVSIVGVVDVFKPTNSNRWKKYIHAVSVNILEDNKEDITISDDIDDVRNTPEYRQWVERVIADSNNVCACCGGTKHLHAHHIMSYADHPDLRLDPDNGIALCKWCHGKYNSYYGHKGTARNLIDFLSKFATHKEVVYVVPDNEPEEVIEKPDRDLLQVFVDTVAQLEDEYYDMCPINVLKSELEDYDETAIDALITSSINKGIVYSPSEGYLKRVII